MRRLLFSALSLALLFALSVSSSSAQTATETVAHNFCLNSVDSFCIDGAAPNYQGVIQASDGNYYGAVVSGGANDLNAGGVFKLTPSGTYTLIYSFCTVTTSDQSECLDGAMPFSGLIEGPDGNLYGTTAYGGSVSCAASSSNYGCGTVFKITPAGKLTTLYTFTGPDGSAPLAALTLGSDGNLYGTTTTGGDYTNIASGAGTIFQITPTGAINTLHTFCGTTNSSGWCVDGHGGTGGLIQATNGLFYGPSIYGGNTTDAGSIFSVSSSGTFNTVYNLCPKLPCPDGAFPYAGLTEGSDGNLYGVAQSGGTVNDAGVIFKLTPAGVITTLYSFCPTLTSGDCPDGEYPTAPLFVASDGNFYGTTIQGGTGIGAPQGGNGTFFQMKPSGAHTTLYNFCQHQNSGGFCTDGSYAESPLLQSSSGDILGATNQGGSTGEGAIFSFALSTKPAAPVQLSFSSSSTAAGSPINLTWAVSNAFSLTMQQCYAYVQGGSTGAGIWNGKQTGTYSSSTKLFTGLASITPTVGGTYTFALTCGGVESGYATLNVTGSGKSDSTTTLTSTPAAPSVGQSVSLKATVTGPGPTPTGSVAFAVSDISIGSVNLNSSGVGTLAASTNGILPGTYPVIATYSGDDSYNLSQSKTLNVKLVKAPTSTTLTASPSTVTPPASVTLTATIKRSATSAVGHPTGTVTFSSGGFVFATVPVVSGVATLTASSSGQAAGSYPIIAIYSGDSSDITSTSSTVTVTLK